MHSRNREMGSYDPSRTFRSAGDGATLEVRRVSSNPEVFEYRQGSIPLGGYAGPFSDKRQIMDVAGNRSGFNSCSQIQDYPVHLSGTLARAWPGEHGVPSLGSNDVTNNWEVRGRDLGKYDMDYSVLQCLGDVTFNPVFDRDILWNNLVSSVGSSLDGQLTAGTNILSMIGELGQTIRMLKNPYGLLTTNWRRCGFTPAAALKKAANVWLEKRYGWDNFRRDAVATATAFQKADAHIRYLMSTRDSLTSAGTRQSDECSYTIPYPHQMGWGGPNDIGIEASNGRCTRTAAFSADILRSSTFEVSSRMHYAMQRLGTTKLYEALWDLLPFSFVVDWFIDVQNLTLAVPYMRWRNQIRNCGYSIKLVWYMDLKVRSYATAWSGYARETNDFNPGMIIRRTYERVAAFPPATLTAGVFQGMSMTHLTDFGALVAQRL